MKELPVIGIITPCYNEELILSFTIEQLTTLREKLVREKRISEKSFIGFVDDGSKDATWKIIEENINKNEHLKGIKLAKNAGHQNALLAGLLSFNNQADALISIDADLQDDISVIENMIEKFKSGSQVVYGVRNERKTDSFFKRNTALLFYKFMQWMNVNIVYNHADFRLMSNRIISELEKFGEVNLFLRGIIPTIGFSSDAVYYNRLERTAGETKYPLKKMLAFAWNGITSFSNYPLKLVTILSFIVFFICILMSFYAVYSLLMHDTVPGWFSTVLPMYFLGGIQLFSLGIIGEYIGKIYAETKKRPRYFIEKILE